MDSNLELNMTTSRTNHDLLVCKPVQLGDGIRLLNAISHLSCLVMKLEFRTLLTQPMSPLPLRSASPWDP
jgi:hypothetical protein